MSCKERLRLSHCSTLMVASCSCGCPLCLSVSQSGLSLCVSVRVPDFLPFDASLNVRLVFRLAFATCFCALVIEAGGDVEARRCGGRAGAGGGGPRGGGSAKK